MHIHEFMRRWAAIMRSQLKNKKRKNFLPHLDWNRGPLELKANVLPVSDTNIIMFILWRCTPNELTTNVSQNQVIQYCYKIGLCLLVIAYIYNICSLEKEWANFLSVRVSRQRDIVKAAPTNFYFKHFLFFSFSDLPKTNLQENIESKLKIYLPIQQHSETSVYSL